MATVTAATPSFCTCCPCIPRQERFSLLSSSVSFPTAALSHRPRPLLTSSLPLLPLPRSPPGTMTSRPPRHLHPLASHHGLEGTRRQRRSESPSAGGAGARWDLDDVRQSTAIAEELLGARRRRLGGNVEFLQLHCTPVPPHKLGPEAMSSCSRSTLSRVGADDDFSPLVGSPSRVRPS
jgi:hypothetical protein